MGLTATHAKAPISIFYNLKVFICFLAHLFGIYHKSSVKGVMYHRNCNSFPHFFKKLLIKHPDKNDPDPPRAILCQNQNGFTSCNPHHLRGFKSFKRNLKVFYFSLKQLTFQTYLGHLNVSYQGDLSIEIRVKIRICFYQGSEGPLFPSFLFIYFCIIYRLLYIIVYFIYVYLFYISLEIIIYIYIYIFFFPFLYSC